MSDDDWGDSTNDGGHGFGRGRFSHNGNGHDDEWGAGGGDRPQSERGRGGRGGRGRGGDRRGGGRGGRGNDDDDWGDGAKRGGFRGGNRRDDSEWGENGRAGDDDRGHRGGRGRGGRGGGRGGGRSEEFGGDEEKTEKPREIYIPPDPTTDESEMFGSGNATGINFDKYDNIKVNVSGENILPPIQSFEASGLRRYLIDNVEKSGYTKPTPIQKYALPHIMEGRDVMACAQTGSGKTAAYLLPILHKLLADQTDAIVDDTHSEPQAVVVSPTRELAIQIHDECRKFSHGSILRTAVIYGGTAVFHQIKQLQRGCHVLVATPGRLIDFANQGRITFNSVRFVVLDEADRMLDMGFLPEMKKFLSNETMVPTGERQTLMFSATFPEEIQRLAGEFLHDYIFITVGIVGGACQDVTQEFFQVDKFGKRNKLLEVFEMHGVNRTLVFVETKRMADFLAIYLCENDFKATSIHGDRLQRERELALGDFRSGRADILVATGVAARGLDIKNVRHVINFDLPKDIDEYVHRIGRTGRVGNNGKATSFYFSEQDASLAKDLIRILEQASQPIPDWLKRDESAGGGGGYSRKRFGGEDFRSENPPPQPPEDEEW